MQSLQHDLERRRDPSGLLPRSAGAGSGRAGPPGLPARLRSRQGRHRRPLCVRIVAALQENEHFRFERIRERQGALRINWDGRLTAASEAAVRSAVDVAEARSICVCERRADPAINYSTAPRFILGRGLGRLGTTR